MITDGSDPKAYIIHILLCLPIILLSLSLHEAAHGYVAHKLGDPTAKNFGRLTLNPIKHLDPVGFICMLLAGIGWANPVPINTRNFKKPRRDMALSAAAGPLSNFLLAAVFCALLKIYSIFLPDVLPNLSGFGEKVFIFLGMFLYYGISLNITLAVFNLLPAPPFDGSRLLYVFLPPKYYFGVMKYERYIGLAIMFLLMFGVLSPVISFVSTKLITLLFTVFDVPPYVIYVLYYFS